MITIGLCGGSGSGKGAVCKLFEPYNIPAIDADKVYSDLIRPGSELLSKLVTQFGSSILSNRGELNRKSLSDIVFADSSGEQLLKLNSITHSSIIKEAAKMIAVHKANGARAVIFDAPLLFESGFDKKCDVTIAVIANRTLRAKRIIERDRITENEAYKRICAQSSDDFLKEHADYIIINNGSIEDLRKEVSSIAEKILTEVTQNERKNNR